MAGKNLFDSTDGLEALLPEYIDSMGALGGCELVDSKELAQFKKPGLDIVVIMEIAKYPSASLFACFGALLKR